MLPVIHLDPCAGKDTHVGIVNFRFPETDGLEQPWFGNVFVNPPFSKKSDFLQKTIDERDGTNVIYVLTPDSTDTKSWWHEYIAEYADYIWFSKGRISYIDPETGEKAGSPTFGTAISIFGEPGDKTLKRFDKKGQLLKTYEP